MLATYGGCGQDIPTVSATTVSVMSLFPLILCVFSVANIGSTRQDYVDVSGFDEGCGTTSKSADHGPEMAGGDLSIPEMAGGDESLPEQFPWVVRLHG